MSTVSRSMSLHGLGFLLLISAMIPPPTSAQPESFTHFLSLFCTDEEFRLERVVWPVEVEYLDYDNDLAVVTEQLDVDEGAKWLRLSYEQCFDGNTTSQIYDNFDRTLRDTGQRVLHFTGNETGVSVAFYFEKREGRWYLVRFVDHST